MFEFQFILCAGKSRRPRCRQQTSLRLLRRGRGLLHRRPEGHALLAASLCGLKPAGKEAQAREQAAREQAAREQAAREQARFGVEFVHGVEVLFKASYANVTLSRLRSNSRNRQCFPSGGAQITDMIRHPSLAGREGKGRAGSCQAPPGTQTDSPGS